MTVFKLILIQIFLFSMVIAITFPDIYEDKSREEWENYLRSSEVILIKKSLEMGRTDFWKVTLDDGKMKKTAVFKYVDRTRPHLIPDSYKYEIAAYILDEFLRLNMVPPTVTRNIEGQIGSLQLFLNKDNIISEEERINRNIEPSNPEDFRLSLQDLEVFETLTYLEPRQMSDIKIDLESWHIFRVDFSEAFAPVPSLLKNRKITGCSKNLFEKLKNIDVKKLQDRLSEYLNEEELKALLIRLELVVDEIDSLIKEKGGEKKSSY
jgi:hypothetical protein